MPPDPADPLVSRARVLWQELSAGPAPPSELPAARGWSSLGSSPAPPSWVGVVAVGDAALITAPTDRAAHLCVLTAPDARGRGLARQVARAATAHALIAGPLPQWRARPPASRRVAQALGYREAGRQLSVRLP